ncbi:hypothetical protein [Bacillus sp. FJAT-27445]|uniref:hypothetical protein n=1 Tax=Bacillus sp. FJAT-27445 TaxID=1679166 RepID=UPI000AFC21D8|nr:hypothetical protein [Bacillus sp. FJAT-27445]
MRLRRLNRDERLPIELLLLADPAKELVKEYTSEKVECFVAKVEDERKEPFT